MRVHSSDREMVREDAALGPCCRGCMMWEICPLVIGPRPRLGWDTRSDTSQTMSRLAMDQPWKHTHTYTRTHQGNGLREGAPVVRPCTQGEGVGKNTGQPDQRPPTAVQMCPLTPSVRSFVAVVIITAAAGGGGAVLCFLRRLRRAFLGKALELDGHGKWHGEPVRVGRRDQRGFRRHPGG
jgi:hypothetical protein